jgi:hypothetical protein
LLTLRRLPTRIRGKQIQKNKYQIFGGALHF